MPVRRNTGRAALAGAFGGIENMLPLMLLLRAQQEEENPEIGGPATTMGGGGLSALLGGSPSVTRPIGGLPTSQVSGAFGQSPAFQQDDLMRILGSILGRV